MNNQPTSSNRVGPPKVVATAAMTIAVSLLMVGCTMNGLNFNEKPIFHKDGEFVGMHTQITSRPVGILGGKLEKGAGTLLYEGVDEDGNKFNLNFGNVTEGLDSGEALTQLVDTVVPLVEQWTAMRATSSAVPPLSNFLLDKLPALLTSPTGTGLMGMLGSLFK